MAHGLDEIGIENPTVSTTDPAGPASKAMMQVNRMVEIASAIALVAASIVLTYSVVTRYFLHFSTDWQDEVSVFLIIGVVFLSSASVQARRGHVGIEAISSILPSRVNHVRQLLVDIASLIFCTYFSWKSWLLLEEAIVEGYRSSSTWQPPLWIPYSLMTLGMVLLSVQLLLQVAGYFRRRSDPV